jgi:hypothetical protein
MKETMKEAGYKYIERIGKRTHILEDIKTGRQEIFTCNKNFSGWGIKYKNTHLEFCGGADNL